MKRFIAFLLSIVFLGSGFAYLSADMIQRSTSNLVFEGLDSELIEEWKEVVSLEPIYEMVPVEYKKEVESVIQKAEKDTKLQNILSNQMGAAMNDVINGSNSFNEHQTVDDMMEVFDEYAEDIESATGKQVPKEVVRQEFKKQISGYNLKTSYEKVIRKVEGKLSPSQLSLLSNINQFNQNYSKIKSGLLLSTVVSLVLIGLLRLRTYFSVGIVALMGVFGIRLMMPKMLNVVSSKVGVPLPTKILNFEGFTDAYIAIAFIIGIGLFALILSKSQLEEY